MEFLATPGSYYDELRRTVAGDSMAMSSITPVHTPSGSAADAASRDSSTASATPGEDGCSPSSHRNG